MLQVIPPFRVEDKLFLPYHANNLECVELYGNCDRCTQPLRQNTFFMSVHYLGREELVHYHHNCFWTVMRSGSNPITCDTIAGIDGLNSVDQNELLRALEEYKESGKFGKIGRSIFHNDPGDELAENTVVLLFPLVTLERYRFNPEKDVNCSICSKPFNENDLIIHQDGLTSSTHVKCIADSDVFLVGTLDSAKGFDTLTEEERQLLMAMMEAKFEQQKTAGKINVEKLTAFGYGNRTVRVLSTTSVSRWDKCSLKRCKTCWESFQEKDIVCDKDVHLSCFFKHVAVILESPEDIQDFQKLSKDGRNLVFKEYFIAVHAGAKPVTLPRLPLANFEKEDVVPTWDIVKRWGVWIGAGLVWTILGDVTEWAPLINIVKRCAGIVDEAELWKEQQIKLDKGRQWLLDKGESRISVIMFYFEIPYDRSNTMSLENIELVTDLLVFGPPKPCPICKGLLRYIPSRRGYICQGVLMLHTRCGYKTRSPQREMHPVPLGFSHEEMFGKKWKETKRLFTKEKGVVSDNWDFFNSVRVYSEIFKTENICDIAYKSRLPPTYRYLVNNTTFLYVHKGHYKSHVLTFNGFSYHIVIPDVTEFNSFIQLMVLRDIETGFFYVVSEIAKWGRTPREQFYERFRDRNAAIACFEREFEKLTAHTWQHGIGADQNRSGLQEDQNNSEMTGCSESETELTVMEVILDLVNDDFAVLGNGPNKLKLDDSFKNICLQGLTDLFNKQVREEATEDDCIQCTRIYHSMFPEDVTEEDRDLLNTKEKTQAAIQIVKQNEDLEIKPFDIFSVIGETKLTVMDPTSLMYENIKTYINKTIGPTHKADFDLMNILEIEKLNENLPFFPNEKKMLLWHGTRKGNVASIIRIGLKLQRYYWFLRFRRGIYFSNCFSESFMYSEIRGPEPSVAYMFLCEVALGTTCMLIEPFKNAQTIDDLLDQGCDSLIGLGLYNTFVNEARVIKTNEFIIPLTVTKTEQRSNEHIGYNKCAVYKEDRVRLKYLLQFRVPKAKYYELH